MIRQIADQIRAILGLAGPLRQGSHTLLERLLGRFGWKPVLGAMAIAAYAVFHYRLALPALFVLWCAAAFMHAPTDKAAAEAKKQAHTAPPEEPLVALIRHHIGDAPGVHLKHLTQRLQEAAPEETIDRPAVRAKLAALGIPVRASVRDAHGRVNEGIHRADLEAWQNTLPNPSPAPTLDSRGSPVATAVTSDVAAPPTPVATPVGRLRRCFGKRT